MYGWRGKALRVDLSRTEIREETLNLQVLKDYVGGRGLGMYYLLRRVTSPNFSGISKKEVRGKKSMQNFQFTI